MGRVLRITGLGLLALVQLSSASRGAPSAAAPLEREAVPVDDLGAILRPFVASCTEHQRERERLRCQALNERLRAQHVSRLYRSSHRPSEAGPFVIHFVGGPQPRAELEVRGCLTCEEPLLERAGGDVSKGRFFLFKVPREIRIRRGPQPYDLGEISVASYHLPLPPGMSEEAFRAQLLPLLRLELYFRPLTGVTSVGERYHYGVTNFELVAHRVYHACSGEVYGASALLTQAPVPREQSCPARRVDAKTLPGASLPARTVEELRALVHSELQSCYEQLGTAGEVTVDLVVSPSGQVRQVKVEGKLARAPLGQCVERLLRGFPFPSFVGDELQLHWSFPLGS